MEEAIPRTINVSLPSVEWEDPFANVAIPTILEEPSAAEPAREPEPLKSESSFKSTNSKRKRSSTANEAPK